MLDETTYYFTAFAIDQNNNIIDSETSSITTDFGWHVTPNTVGYWTLVGNANDSSGNNRNGTANGVSFGTYDGIDCAYFNGSGSTKIQIPGMGSFSEITMVIWAKTSDSLPNTSVLFMVSPTADNKNLAIQGNSGTFVLSRWNGSSAYNITDGTANNGVWHCVIATYDNSGSDLYVDGVHIGHDSRSTQVASDNGHCSMGGHASSTNSNFVYKGYLSTAIIENKKRSEAEGISYYNKVKKQFGY